MTKQYVILNYENLEVTKRRDDPKQAEAYWGAWMAYVEAINEAGIVRGGEGLDYPSTATTVTINNGKQEVQDGPFADTKEQLAGFFIIEVPNLDVALEWAARNPASANGKVEVRPVLPKPSND
ncbi:MAG: YciI family protein [Pseudomonadota bacterium]